MRSWLAILFVAALVVGTVIAGQLFALGCSETKAPGTTTETCDAIGDAWTFSWWIAVLWPAALFIGSRVVPKLRDHVFLSGVLSAGLAAVFWTPLLLYVTSNL